MSDYEDRKEFDRPDDDSLDTSWEDNGYSSEQEYWNERL